MNSTASAVATGIPSFLENAIGGANDLFARGIRLPPVVRDVLSLVLPQSPLPTAPAGSPAPHFARALATESSPIAELLRRHSRSSEPFFELEPAIAALAVFFCRFVIVSGSLTASPDGHSSVLGSNWMEFAMRLTVSLVLAAMAYLRMDYDLICAVHLWSHALPTLVAWFVGFMDDKKKKHGKKKKQKPSTPTPSLAMSLGLSLILLLSMPLCLYICRLLSDPDFLLSAAKLAPRPVRDAFRYMFPIEELAASYEVVTSFVSDKVLLHDMLAHLLFVTFHLQTGLGHIGIAFLTSEQRRKNMLIRMDVENPPPPKKKKKKKTDGDGGDDDARSGSDEKFDPSRKFRRSAPGFILFTVLPYMFQIILFGNLNKFSFINVQNQIHRSVRIHELFDHDSHLTAIATDGATSPDVYAGAMDTVVSTAYDMFNRKLFSLPKLIILPAVISRQPLLLAKIFPLIFVTDMMKGRIVASVTDKVEQFQREAREVNSVRQKVEQFDMKNAELLRRSGIGATKFTEQRWDELTLEYQAKMAAGDLLRRTRGFFLWLQRNFVFVVLIDCALAKLLAEGSIVVAEIFVFSRAIEDVVDLLLIRSRSESELATLMTEVDKLKVLEGVWGKSKDARLLPCHIGSSNDDGGENQSGIILNNVQYTRGTATVAAEHLVIEPGIYAVTGANGSGKSTLFRLLMACDTIERPIDLHESIELATPLHQWDLSDNLILPEESCKVPDEGCEVIEKVESGGNGSESNPASDAPSNVGTEEIPVTSIVLPSPDIVEISQTFYWPLYSKPIDWIYQKHITSDLNETERADCVKKIAEELQSLSFAQSQADDTMIDELEDEGVSNGVGVDTSNAAIVERLIVELQEEKEDWFSELSGGQKSKVELVRKVFLRDECPSVLLVDETMAPLDPASKSQVMSKLKAFCSESVVLVIYHTDVGRTSDATSQDDDECVPSNSFFDYNLHVENKHLTTRPVC